MERRAELLALLGQHVVLVLTATGIAALIGLPLGLVLTRHERLARYALGVTSLLQTIPSLALFGFLIPLPLVGGIGPRTAIVALVLYALLPIVRNTYTGIRQVDPVLVEAVTGLGMSSWQRLSLLEIPLALPVILAGLRLATVVSVGTATIAAAIGGGGLGTYVFRGIATVDTRLLLAGAIPTALLALFADALLGAVERSRRPGRAMLLLVAAMLVGLALLRGAGSGGSGSIVIGSKNFTEQVLLGEILAARLEQRGFQVDRRLNLGGTTLCHEAIRTGAIDAYVEYSGTALTDVLKQPATADPARALGIVRARYGDLGLLVGSPLGFNNTFALVVRPEDAAAGLGRISDLASRAGSLRVALFGEFLERADGLPGLQRAYGFRLGVRPVEMDLGLLYTALEKRQVDLVVGSATDGLIAARGFVVLEDDRAYFPPYDAVCIMNARSVARHPGLEAAVASLAGRIDAATMRQLNYAVDGEHRAAAAVAREFVGGLR